MIKSDNFDGNYSPRVSAVFSADEQKNTFSEVLSKQVSETQLHKINILV
jgi:hypothetical protein